MDRDSAGGLLRQMVAMARVFRVTGYRRQSISGTKIGILQRLKDSDIRLGELASQLAISAPVASRAVDSLEAEGLLERRPDKNDGRAHLISLTILGRETVGERERHIADQFAAVLGDWTAEEATQALEVLRRLNYHLDELSVALGTDDKRDSAT